MPTTNNKPYQMPRAAVFLLISGLLITSCAGTPDQESSPAEPVPIAQPSIDKEAQKEIQKEAPTAPPSLPDSMTTSPANAPVTGADLPEIVRANVFQDIAANHNVSTDALTIVGARPESWPDGCLGLGGPGDICTFAIVDGWEVTVSQGNNLWVYRTDNDGLNIRSVDVPDTESF